ncbi:Scr1 family TA system antitoxin-like transcriptional regulator [Streptomyces chartreusis]
MPEIPKLRNVTLQVLPFDAGAYPTAGSFTVLGFPEQEDPDVVYRVGGAPTRSTSKSPTM